MVLCNFEGTLIHVFKYTLKLMLDSLGALFRLVKPSSERFWTLLEGFSEISTFCLIKGSSFIFLDSFSLETGTKHYEINNVS